MRRGLGHSSRCIRTLATYLNLVEIVESVSCPVSPKRLEKRRSSFSSRFQGTAIFPRLSFYTSSIRLIGNYAGKGTSTPMILSLECVTEGKAPSDIHSVLGDQKLG